MINIFKILIKYLYIDRCYFCGSSKEDKEFCSKCFDKIEYLPNSCAFKILEKPVYGATTYRDNIKKLIRAVKYHNKKNLALKQYV